METDNLVCLCVCVCVCVCVYVCVCVWGGGGRRGVNGEEGMGVFPITDPLGYVPSLIRSMFCGSISSRRGLALKAKSGKDPND